MQTARRLYIYLISGVGLGVMVAGASMLLGVVLERLGMPGLRFDDGPSAGERLTLAAALVAVGAPVWGVHWFLAERSVRPDRSDGVIERNATLRGVYFALVLGGLLLTWASGLDEAIGRAALRVAQSDDFTSSMADDVARFLVAGVAWLYHVRVRERDWARGPISGGAAMLPRAYVYLAALLGLLSFLVAVTGLLGVAWEAWVREPPPGPGRPFWAISMASGVAQATVGGLVWLGHAWHARRVVGDPGWRGDSERPARLRTAYFVAAVVTTLALTLQELVQAAGGIVRAAAGLDVGRDDPLGLVIVPLLSAIPFAVVAWLHARRLRAEASDGASAARTEAADRLGFYPVALVGLAFAAVGAARLGGAIINGLFGTASATDVDWFVRAVADEAPRIVLGAATWWWSWRAVTARVAAHPVEEAASTIRRASLLVALAASVLAGVSGAAVVLYRLFGGLFGVQQPGDAVADLSTPLATLAVAGAIAVFHAMLLRTDLARVPKAAPEQVAPTVRLRITGPAGANVDDAVASVRASLPTGFTAEVVEEPSTDD